MRTCKRSDVLAGEGPDPALVATGGRAGQRERRGQVAGGPHRPLEAASAENSYFYIQ